MYSDILAVALRTVRHNDRSSILTVWSPTVGRLSLVMPAGNGRESQRRRALTMPMGLIEGVVDIRPGKTVHHLRDIRGWGPAGQRPDVSSHPVRASVALFAAEVLGVVTREGDGDPALWSLVVDTAVRIAGGDALALAYVPLTFLMRLADVIGISPDFHDRRPGFGLDMAEGVFRATRPLHDHWVDADGARLLDMLRTTVGRGRGPGLMRLSRSVRARLLDGLLDYFTLHQYPLDRLRSLDILRAVQN